MQGEGGGGNVEFTSLMNTPLYTPQTPEPVKLKTVESLPTNSNIVRYVVSIVIKWVAK